MNIPLPWERLLWSGRSVWPLSLSVERYYLTDFRLVRVSARGMDELALSDIADISRTESPLERAFGISTIVIQSRRGGDSPLRLSKIRRGASVAAALELLIHDPDVLSNPDAFQAALAWEPRSHAAYREAAGAFAAVLTAIAAIAFGLRGHAVAVHYAPDDAIAPSGVKKTRTEINQMMEQDVLPWARTALARIVGGTDRVTCRTCHGENPDTRNWQMPAVAALPEPEVRERGWETSSASMDAQMRNAIYGYLAEPEKSAKAAYMREVVVPGMAALLHRPAYDFTQSYEYNRSRNALGCYHCHRVK